MMLGLHVGQSSGPRITRGPVAFSGRCAHAVLIGYAFRWPETQGASLVETCMKSDKIKLIVAIVIFAVAAVIIAIQLFGGGGGQPEIAAPKPGEQPRGGPRAVSPGN